MKTRSQTIWSHARRLFGDLLDAPVPSPEDQARLVAELATVQPGSSRDLEIRNELALMALRLAIAEFARRAYVPAGREDEAVDEAVETLMKASGSFDPTAGKPFTAYVAAQIVYAARRYSIRMRASGADSATVISLDSADDDDRVLSEVLADEREDEDEVPRTPIAVWGLPLRESLVVALISGREPADPVALRALRWALRKRFGDDVDIVPQLKLADACAVLGVSRRAVSDRLRSLLRSSADANDEQLVLL